MFGLSAIAAGTVLAVGVYLLTDPHPFRRILGVVCLGHAANLCFFITSDVRGRPAFVGPDGPEPGLLANPLPQALVLTAIVIGLCVVTLLAAIAFRNVQRGAGDDSKP